MADETVREELRIPVAVTTAPEIRTWFVGHVLPLEAVLMQYLYRNWHNKSDIQDLLQDVYVRACDAARKQIPNPTKPFVFSIARNLLIDRVRRERIIPIEAVSDLDALEIAKDEPDPECSAIAREELRRVQSALDNLPPRCRQAILLKQVEGLTRRQIAQRMGIGEGTVKEYVADGVRALADVFYGEAPDIRRRT